MTDRCDWNVYVLPKVAEPSARRPPRGRASGSITGVQQRPASVSSLGPPPPSQVLLGGVEISTQISLARGRRPRPPISSNRTQAAAPACRRVHENKWNRRRWRARRGPVPCLPLVAPPWRPAGLAVTATRRRPSLVLPSLPPSPRTTAGSGARECARVPSAAAWRADPDRIRPMSARAPHRPRPQARWATFASIWAPGSASSSRAHSTSAATACRLASSARRLRAGAI